MNTIGNSSDPVFRRLDNMVDAFAAAAARGSKNDRYVYLDRKDNTWKTDSRQHGSLAKVFAQASYELNRAVLQEQSPEALKVLQEQISKLKRASEELANRFEERTHGILARAGLASRCEKTIAAGDKFLHLATHLEDVAGRLVKIRTGKGYADDYLMVLEQLWKGQWKSWDELEGSMLVITKGWDLPSLDHVVIERYVYMRMKVLYEIAYNWPPRITGTRSATNIRKFFGHLERTLCELDALRDQLPQSHPGYQVFNRNVKAIIEVCNRLTETNFETEEIWPNLTLHRVARKNGNRITFNDLQGGHNFRHLQTEGLLFDIGAAQLLLHRQWGVEGQCHLDPSLLLPCMDLVNMGVSKMAGSMDEFDRQLKSLRESWSGKTITADKIDLTNSALVGALTQIEALNFSGLVVEAKALQKLLKACPNLTQVTGLTSQNVVGDKRNLNLSGCNSSVAKEVLKAYTGLESTLEQLNLTGVRGFFDTFHQLCTEGKFPKLKWFKLGPDSQDDHTLKKVVEILTHLPALRNFSMLKDIRPFSPADFDSLFDLQQKISDPIKLEVFLRQILWKDYDLQMPKASQKVFEALQGVPYLNKGLSETSATTVPLARTAMTLELLQQGDNRGLREPLSSLADSPNTSDAILSEIKESSLDLRRCPQLTNEGVFAFLQARTSLKSLALSGCTQIDDELVSLIEQKDAKGAILGRLQTLFLRNTGMSPGAVERLRALNPQLDIAYDDEYYRGIRLRADTGTDLTVTAGGRAFSVHSEIITASSSFLAGAITADHTLNLPLSAKAADVLLTYLYTTEVVGLDEEVAWELLQNADTLQLPTLANRCLLYLSNSIRTDNVVAMYKKASQEHCEPIRTACWRFVNWCCRPDFDRKPFSDMPAAEQQAVKDIFLADDIMPHSIVTCSLCFPLNSNLKNDVTLVASDGTELEANLGVLARHCTLFSDLLTKEERGEEIEIPIALSGPRCEQVIQYAMTERAPDWSKFDLFQLEEFVHAACYLGIESWSSEIDREMRGRLVGLSKEVSQESLKGIQDILTVARRYQMRGLGYACIDYLIQKRSDYKLDDWLTDSTLPYHRWIRERLFPNVK